MLLILHVELSTHVSAALKADMFLDIDSRHWPPLVHHISNVAAVDPSEHGCDLDMVVALLGCVCVPTVCVLLSPSQVVAELSV